MGRTAGVPFALCLVVSTLCLAQTSPREQRTSRYFESVKQQPLLLQAFLREMPKGGDLHNHYGGSVYAESFINYATHDGLCVERNTLTLVSPPCDDVAGRPTAATALTDPNFYAAIVDAFSMRNWHPARDSGHDHFFATFSKFALAIPAHRGEMLAELASRAAFEHVAYLELMTEIGEDAAIRLAAQSASDDDNFDHARQKLLATGMADVVADSRRSLDQAESDMRSRLRCSTPRADPGCGIVIRYLFQVLRGMPRGQVFSQLLAGFELAQADPRVVGVNMVMPEDWYLPMRDFELHMRMLDYLHAAYSKVHISLHAGELAPGLVPPEALSFHIRESVERGHAERIGHGVSVMYEREPIALLKEMAQRNVLVEICLTSNDLILGISGTQHPLPLYIKHGVPVALATDDPGVSRSDMTHEFQRAVESYGVSYADLKRMVRAALEHSFLSGASLWINSVRAQKTEACASDDPSAGKLSRTCQDFLNASDKARVQWEEEKAFARFETRY